MHEPQNAVFSFSHDLAKHPETAVVLYSMSLSTEGSKTGAKKEKRSVSAGLRLKSDWSWGARWLSG